MILPNGVEEMVEYLFDRRPAGWVNSWVIDYGLNQPDDDRKKTRHNFSSIRNWNNRGRVTVMPEVITRACATCHAPKRLDRSQLFDCGPIASERGLTNTFRFCFSFWRDCPFWGLVLKTHLLPRVILIRIQTMRVRKDYFNAFDMLVKLLR